MHTKIRLTAIVFAIAVAASATEIRFVMRSINGRTNDVTLTVQALKIPFVSSNYVVTGYPLQMQTLGGTVTTNLVPAQYRLTVVGPLPAQAFRFTVPQTTNVLNASDLMTK